MRTVGFLLALLMSAASVSAREYAPRVLCPDRADAYSLLSALLISFPANFQGSPVSTHMLRPRHQGDAAIAAAAASIRSLASSPPHTRAAMCDAE